MGKAGPDVLIIGGGVAGISAARTFAGQDIVVHLVEKENYLGGHAAQWACMATDACENCSACLSIEMADQVQNQENVIIHLNTGIKSIEKNKPGYGIELDNGKTFAVQKIILATGFSPFDAAGIGSLHYDAYENVITTADLNSVLRKDRLKDYLNGKSAPEIAFIQCVGSRNRDQGRDYCSQVCCKISMRHAEKLVHLYPECNITVFYMDLQIIGKETRTLFKRLSDNVTLLQGVPGEILKDEKTQRLVITTEDEKGVARISRQFDLIVLSVGMVPPQDIENTLTMLGSNPNSWGFFNTDKAEPGKDVIVAGCAEGPKDILSSIQDGKIAALEVIEELGIQKKDQKPDVAVLGNGVQAGITAEKIASYGYQVHLFGPAAASDSITGVNMVDNARIITVQGTAGNFSIYYESGGEKKYLTCAAIIASAEPDRLSTGPAGLKNSCMGLDEFCSMAARSPDEINNDTAIVLDYSGPEFKEPARLALTAAIKAAEAGKNISIIANKMLVHGPSGQQIYDSARQAGVSFLRFKTQEDLKFEKNPKGVTIKIKEATLPSLELSLECECIVFPDTRISGSVFRHMADRLNQHLDCEGFLQGANIRHRLTGSPRKGIFFAGSGHDDIDMDDLDREIQAIAAALATGGFDQPNADTGVEINQKKCAQCLTCIRVCPHNAIVMNNKNRPQIVPDACCSCHLCVANCPAYAIDSKELTNDQIADRAEKGRVMLLACERSAALAAGNLSLPAHIELVKIPCACRISSDIILRLLLNGASKVIISGCHEDNCRSLEGSRTAGENVQKVLSIPGMDNSKVVWEPVAANESVKIEQIIAKA